jgi:hypothetical protein
MWGSGGFEYFLKKRRRTAENNNLSNNIHIRHEVADVGSTGESAGKRREALPLRKAGPNSHFMVNER